MLHTKFQGWFQCRFATDPDPADARRGLTGPTFAVPGEPDLDRIIRLNNFDYPRFPRRQEDGVKVYQVLLDDKAIAKHPLLGAQVNLLNKPIFRQRNQIVAPSAMEAPIDPFHLQIKEGKLTVQREDLADITNPSATLEDVFLNKTLFDRRLNDMTLQSPEAAEATGIMNYEQYRLERAEKLRALEAKSKDPVEKAAYQKRIKAIEKDKTMTGVMLANTQFLGLKAGYQFSINGPAKVKDPENKLGGQIGFSQDWPLAFWLGAYDVDTMFGYMRGTLSLPFFPSKP